MPQSAGAHARQDGQHEDVMPPRLICWMGGNNCIGNQAKHQDIGNESVPEIIANDTINLVFTARCYASAY